MDGKSRILIVSFLGRIGQVASKEKHRKAGGHSLFDGVEWSGEGSRFQRSLATPTPRPFRHPT